MQNDTKNILAKHLIDIITDNPAIKECFIDLIQSNLTIKECFITVMKKMAEDRKDELTHRVDCGIDLWRKKGHHGRDMTEWVKLGEKKYPQIWVFNNLVGTWTESNQQQTEDFFKVLGLETRQ